jgi:hypothetical protein
VTCSFYFLPKSFSIPVALLSIYLSGKVLCSLCQASKKIRSIRDYLKEGFKKGPNETLEAFRDRRWQVIKCIIKYTLLFSAATGVICFASKLISILRQAKSFWSITDQLPYQTQSVVMAEYFAVGILHLAQAICKEKADNKQAAFFHVLSAVLTFFFPLHQMPTRLHHSFVGLALQLSPCRPVRFFGSMVTFDSALYLFSSDRALVDNKGVIEHYYDYMNTVTENLPFVLLSLTLLSLLQKVLEAPFSLKKETEKDKKKTIETTSKRQPFLLKV